MPLNIFSFPFWWYSTGFRFARKWYAAQFHYAVNKTGIVLFARHLFEPLYGYKTRADRIFSFFLRIFLLFVKLVAFLFRLLYISIALLLYLAALPIAILLIVHQLLPKLI